jgi:hypothetical protein
MAPNTQEPCWPWGGKERDKGPPPPPPPLAVTATPLTPVTANVIANLPHKSLKRQTAITSHKTAIASSAATKRLKVDHHSSNNNSVKVTSRCATQCVSKSKCCNTDSKSHEVDASPLTKVPQQGKITEYFKAQLKPLNGVKKELAVKSGSGMQQGRKEPKTCETTAGLNKYFPSLLSGTKSAAAKSPTRNVPLSKASDTKRDAVPSGGTSQSWVKSSIDSKPSKVSQKVSADKKTGAVVAVVAARKASSSSASKFLEAKRNGLNIPTSSQKLNALLSPSATQNSQSLSLVESAQKAGLTSPANGTPKGVLSSEAVFKSGKEAITKPKMVSETECEASPLCDEPTPILSVPTTIRFPAIASDSSCSSSSVVPPKPSSSQSESPDTITCRWSECETHFDTSTGLLEHLQVSIVELHAKKTISWKVYR